jgi:hypothetical protein
MGGKSGPVGGGMDFATKYPNIVAARNMFREKLHSGPLGQMFDSINNAMQSTGDAYRASHPAAAPAAGPAESPNPPASVAMTESNLGGVDAAAPAGPGIGADMRVTEDPGGAGPAGPPAMTTGNMIAQSMVAPSMWTDQYKKSQAPGGAGSLNISGQV